MLRLYSMLILAASLFWGCVIGFFDGDIESKCGEEKYTAANQICENGVLMKMCGDEYYNSKMQFCFNNIIFEKCGNKNYDPSNQKCENHVVLDKCNNEYYNSAMQFCFKNAIYDYCGYYPYNVETHVCKDGNLFPKCGDEYFDPSFEYCFNNAVKDKEELIDSRDGKIYKYVHIGSQIWMAENLRYETSNSKCYEDNINRCETFGRFYDWNTAKTVCPSGWHLPNNREWNTLRNFAGGDSAGIRLKAKNGHSRTGTDDFGFTVLPSACYKKDYYSRGYFWLTGCAAFWSTGSADGVAYHYYFNSYGEESLISNDSDIYLINVRCIKD